MKRRQVCLFGTSADPPTGEGGHVGIVKALVGTGDYDEVRIIPVYSHSFANKRDRLLAFDRRLKMCQLSFEDIPGATVSDCEKRCFERKAAGVPPESLPGVRIGTADLLDMLIEEEPDVDFSFALGGDTFMDLSDWKWRRSRDVLKLLDGRIVVFVRKGHDVQELEHRVERTNSSSEGGHVKLLRVSSLEAVSSTLARSSKEEADLQGMVHGKVLEYIITNGLYGFNDAS